MALPTVHRTWQYNVNQSIPYPGTMTAQIATTFITLVATLTGFATQPWTVWGASDAVAVGNGDHVNRWTVPGSIVHNTAGVPHSWIVLSQPTGLHVCIDLRQITPENGEIIISKTGFGAANGGTDGTKSARPTAIDEVVTLALGAMFGGTGSANLYLHVQHSTDGQSTRVFLCRNGYSIWGWVFDTTDPTLTGWDGIAVTTLYNGSGAPTYVALTDNANWHGWIAGASVTFYATAEGYLTNLFGELQTYADDDSAAWAIGSAGLACPTASHRGRKGQFIDLWLGSNGRGTGTQYPADTSRTHAQFGALVVPWNGTQALTYGANSDVDGYAIGLGTIADTTSPVVTLISPVAGTAVLSTDAVTIRVTDETSLSRVIISVQQGTNRELAHDETGYVGMYASSTKAAVSGGFDFVVRRTGGWTYPPTIYVSPNDASGNLAV